MVRTNMPRTRWERKRQEKGRCYLKCAEWAIFRLFIFDKEKQLTSTVEANTSHYRPLTASDRHRTKDEITRNGWGQGSDVWTSASGCSYFWPVYGPSAMCLWLYSIPVHSKLTWLMLHISISFRGASKEAKKEQRSLLFNPAAGNMKMSTLVERRMSNINSFIETIFGITGEHMAALITVM